MKICRLFPAALLACSVLIAGNDRPCFSAVQETAPEVPPQSGAEVASKDDLPTDFEGLMAKWTESRAELVELKEKFDSTLGIAEKDAILQEFTSKLSESNNILDRLRDSALAGLSEGNLDEVKVNTLVGIMINDANNRMDDRVLATGQTLIEMGIDPAKFQTASTVERLSVSGREIFEELVLRQKEHSAGDLPRVSIKTNRGEIVVELFENEAPNTVANFISLVKKGFYDGLKFHRVLEGFVIQGGDPNGNGTGGPGYNIECECDEIDARRHFTASLSMAHAGKDTGGSQFFITLTRADNVMALDGRHTVFGRVVSGFDVLDQIMRTEIGGQPVPGIEPDVMEKVEVVRDRGHEYKVRKVGDKEETESPRTTPDAMKDDSGQQNKLDAGAGEQSEEKAADKKEGDGGEAGGSEAGKTEESGTAESGKVEAEKTDPEKAGGESEAGKSDDPPPESSGQGGTAQ